MKMDRRILLGLLPIIFLAGCTQDMKDGSRIKPYEASVFFADGRSERPLVAGTVPYGSYPDNTVFLTGKADGKPVDYFPFKVTPEILKHGQERYNIYCIVCHDATGSGNGMVIRRGFQPKAASYHIDRLRQAPPGYLFDVMTNGLGAMPDYKAQIPAYDRWTIAAYVRALQLSQHATMNDVPAAAQKQLLEKKA